MGTDFARARPKSASFSSPASLIRRFWGFKSLGRGGEGRGGEGRGGEGRGGEGRGGEERRGDGRREVGGGGGEGRGEMMAVRLSACPSVCWQYLCSIFLLWQK